MLELTEKAPYICQLPQKDLGCIVDRQDGTRYNGTINKSTGGHECLRWNTISDTLLHENLGLSEKETDQVKWDHNYCRTLGDDPAPFCFINLTGVVTTDFCDIPNCKDKVVIIQII